MEVYKEFSTSCSTLNLKKIRSYVIEQLKGASLKESDINLIVLAVDEVCANIIIHSNKQNSEKKLEICLHKKESQLVFEIFDTGRAFNPNSYLEPSLKDVVEKGQKGGIGMMIVRRVMDKIEYDTIHNRNVCRLYKSLEQ